MKDDWQSAYFYLHMFRFLFLERIAYELMRIQKILNNNVVQTSNKNKDELIVMGRGIAFQGKVGDTIDEEKIQKTFILKDDDSMFADIYKELSTEEIDTVFSIVKLAEEKLQQNFESHVYITLGDHLHYAIERQKDNMPLTNPLAWEVRRLYKAEYQIGVQALDIIEERTGVRLVETEASAIALHLINAQKEGHRMEQTMRMLKIVQGVLNIVRLHFGYDFDEDSFAYQRFVTHLQYFAQRVNSNLQQGSNDSFLYEQVRDTYPQSFKCSEKIKQYIESTYDFPVGREEQVYLTIHIQKLTTK